MTHFTKTLICPRLVYSHIEFH